MSIISNQTKEQLFIARVNYYTRLGRQMTVDQLMAAEDHGKFLMGTDSPTLRMIGKHLVRFVNRILSE